MKKLTIISFLVLITLTGCNSDSRNKQESNEHQEENSTENMIKEKIKPELESKSEKKTESGKIDLEGGFSKDTDGIYLYDYDSDYDTQEGWGGWHLMKLEGEELEEFNQEWEEYQENN
jgi:hypothetical protein